MKEIPFNRPYYHDIIYDYIRQVVKSGKSSGDGVFTQKCEAFFESRYNVNRFLLTPSCTDALELAAILLDIKSGDEVIVPSYTFVSSVNPFLLRGANIVFCDSENETPQIDLDLVESLITSKTKILLLVHYAGFSCNMKRAREICEKNNIFLVEDAAQCIDSYYENKALGSWGDLGAISFHDTKNITCGEGGGLFINNRDFLKRAEIIREKGTNRAAFFRGEVDKYGWVDVGSSFLLSEFSAAILWSQLDNIDTISLKRMSLWKEYFRWLLPLKSKGILLPPVIENKHNGHIFYIVCNSIEERQNLISYLAKNKFKAVFHYLSLHKSEFFKLNYYGRELPNSDRYTNCLLRLPLYHELDEKEVESISKCVLSFYDDYKY